MLCCGVATYHRYGVCTVRCVECNYTLTQHSEQYTYRTYDMLPHHSITYNDTVFIDS